MNSILSLSGKKFSQQKRSVGAIIAKLPKGASVHSDDLENLLKDLNMVAKFWENNTLLNGVLVNVKYKKIAAKSNRIQIFLKEGSHTPNDSIVGARFNDDKSKHIITHFVKKEVLLKTIKLLEEAIDLFKSNFPDGLDDKTFDDGSVFKKINFESISKTTFKLLVRDVWFVEKFDVTKTGTPATKSSIVTFYDVNENILNVLSKIGINISEERLLDKSTALLDEQFIKILFDRAPFLVSMSVEDLNELNTDDFFPGTKSNNLGIIVEPKNEPIIGVIDTLFDEDVYFSKWVEFHDEISDQISKSSTDYRHGTAVTSLIVDGPTLNPQLDDGCGHFRVRHFGVSLASGFNSFSIIKTIRRIVETNQDIKVWNLSLGSNDEIRDNFISAEGAILDELQFEFDVIFVIAGTNQMGSHDNSQRQKIGSPADSINSLIVNSVDSKNRPVSYSRQGIVLSFFTKPDVSYYGGGNGEYINVVEPLGLARVAGTSYAAPLVARKLAYLIHIVGLKRELAKALLIDSAIGWSHNTSFDSLSLIGNGVVPISINEIIQTPNDEIKFMVSDTSEEFNSYNYNFPVPIKDNKFPYIAKATMVYFPKTQRSQGVDYTNTELNLKFGRLIDVAKGEPIRSINNDKQNSDDIIPHYLYEQDARRLFRKWDNVKHIGERFTKKIRAKDILNSHNPQWGMSVKTTERLSNHDGKGISFGVVVTLKAIDGKNRIEEFINSSELRGWIVNKIELQTQIEMYNELTQEIHFD